MFGCDAILTHGLQLKLHFGSINSLSWIFLFSLEAVFYGLCEGLKGSVCVYECAVYVCVLLHAC